MIFRKKLDWLDIRIDWRSIKSLIDSLHKEHFLNQKNKCQGNSMTIQWLGLHIATAGSPGLIPDEGTKILKTVRWSKKLNKCQLHQRHIYRWNCEMW